MFGQAMNTQGNPSENITEEDAVQEAIRLSLQEPGTTETKPEEKKQKTEVDESFEDLYDEDEKKETKKVPEVIECELNLDAIYSDKAALENTTQIMAVFGVPEEKKMVVYKWVQAKETNAVNELLNLYIDEMAGRI